MEATTTTTKKGHVVTTIKGLRYDAAAAAGEVYAKHMGLKPLESVSWHAWAGEAGRVSIVQDGAAHALIIREYS